MVTVTDIHPSPLSEITQQPSFIQFTDYPSLCAPHVIPLQDVLTGKRYQYQFHYADAWFRFYHGCFMSQVIFENRIFALPPLYHNTDGQIEMTPLSETKSRFLEEWQALPRHILFFYAALLNTMIPESQLFRILPHLPKALADAFQEIHLEAL